MNKGIELHTSDGETIHVPVDIAERWSYFIPLLSGRWDSNRVSVPFSLNELQAWLSLDETMLASTDKTENYSSIAEVVEYFGYKDESWLAKVIVDSNVPQDKRKQAYLRQGRWVRSTGSLRPYLNNEDKYVLHGNFFVGRDPVYDHTAWVSYYDCDMPTRRWSEPITAEQRDRALAIDSLSVLAGIVHSSYLRSRDTSSRDNEIPWTCVPWQDVISFLPNSLLLAEGEEWAVHRRQTMLQSNRDLALSDIEKRANQVSHDYYEYALADMIPPSQPRVFSEKYAGFNRHKSSGIHFSPQPHQDKVLLNIGLSHVLQFYDKMSEAMSKSSYTSKLKGEGARKLDVLRKRLVLSGLSPVLEGGTPQDIGKYSHLEASYGSKAVVVVTPPTIVTIMNLNALYRSQWFRKDSDIYINNATIPTEDFPAVVQYFSETLGSAALNRAAVMLMEYYEELPHNKKDERLILFSQLALDALPDGELGGPLSIP